MSDARLHPSVRTLLLAIGALLIVESVGSWTPTGLPLGGGTPVVAAACAGVRIGAVSTLLGFVLIGCVLRVFKGPHPAPAGSGG